MQAAAATCRSSCVKICHNFLRLYPFAKASFTVSPGPIAYIDQMQLAHDNLDVEVYMLG
jgi:hypothetical protein